MDWKTDPKRESTYEDATGIYVRAIGQDGRWDSFDLAQLDRDSALSFIHSRGEVNVWAEGTILTLLRHERG